MRRSADTLGLSVHSHKITSCEQYGWSVGGLPAEVGSIYGYIRQLWTYFGMGVEMQLRVRKSSIALLCAVHAERQAGLLCASHCRRSKLGVTRQHLTEV